MNILETIKNKKKLIGIIAGIVVVIGIAVSVTIIGFGNRNGNDPGANTIGKLNEEDQITESDTESGSEADSKDQDSESLENTEEVGDTATEVTEEGSEDTTEAVDPNDSESTETTGSNSDGAAGSGSQGNSGGQSSGGTQGNTGSQSGGSSQGNHTTTEQQQPTAPYIVDYVTEVDGEILQAEKFGVKQYAITYTSYSIYSDGSRQANSQFTSEGRVDASGYCATDAELLAESNAIYSQNLAYYNRVLELVNQIRSEAGVAPLTLDRDLCIVAGIRAVEINYSGLFSHTRPNGNLCYEAAEVVGVSLLSMGENIAAGRSTPESVVEGWKNSPGHYSNMINTSYTRLGVGYSNAALDGCGYRYYWTQFFGS